MKRNLTVLAALVVVVMMIGCAGASQRMRDGATIGAAIGAGAGLVKGSNGKHIVGLGLLGAAAGSLIGVAMDEVYGPIPQTHRPVVYGSQSQPGYYPDCSAFYTLGERVACEKGYAREETRIQRQRERAAERRGRNMARRRW